MNKRIRLCNRFSREWGEIADMRLSDKDANERKTMQFDVMKKADSIFQSLVVRRCPMKLTQSINSKSDSIDLLLCIQRLPMSIYAPINSSKLCIIKAVDYFTFGTSGNFQIFGLMQQAVSSSNSSFFMVLLYN